MFLTKTSKGIGGGRNPPNQIFVFTQRKCLIYFCIFYMKNLV